MRHDIFGVIPQFSLYNTPIAKKPSPFTAEWLQKKTILTAHGWMMFVSWGIVAPLWAFSRRYVKGTSRVWDTVQFWSHIVLVGVMSLVAVGLGIYAVTPNAQFDDAHSVGLHESCVKAHLFRSLTIFYVICLRRSLASSSS